MVLDTPGTPEIQVQQVPLRRSQALQARRKQEQQVQQVPFRRSQALQARRKPAQQVQQVPLRRSQALQARLKQAQQVRQAPLRTSQVPPGALAQQVQRERRKPALPVPQASLAQAGHTASLHTRFRRKATSGCTLGLCRLR